MKSETACAPPSRLISLFLRTAEAIEKRLDAVLADLELSVPKYSALSKLAEAEEPLALGELASRLTCVRSNITQLVDRLEADGLVRRVEDPRDRRSVRAALTALGRERQEAGSLRVQEVRETVAAVLSWVDCDELEKALAQLK